MGCETQLAWKCLFTPTFWRAILTGKTDYIWLEKVRFLACDQGSIVGLRVKDYKSLCAAVTICSTLVNIQTDVHTRAHTQTAFQPAYMESSASWARNNSTNLHMKAVSMIAAKCRHVIITKAWIQSRCQNWRTTFNLVRCKAIDCTICWLDDDVVVVLRHTVVESSSVGLNHKNANKLDSRKHVK